MTLKDFRIIYQRLRGMSMINVGMHPGFYLIFLALSMLAVTVLN
jgi:hypothetical protein